MRRPAALVAVALAAALILVVAGERREGATRPEPGSTLTSTYSDPDGDGQLDRGPGEPLVDRSELAPATRTARQLALFAQFSDAHVMDEESPARLPFLDRLGSPFNSTFRPQEALSGQVLAATVESLNALGPQAVVATGDLIDNAQEGELDDVLAILRGGMVDPDSGRVGYEGVQSGDNPDPLYYRPDVDAPRRPGLLEEAQRPFRSPGLRAPWYPVVGNHDLLFEGELTPSARTSAVATGSKRLLRLDPSIDVPTDERALRPGLVDRLLTGGLPGPSERVASDPARRQLGEDEVERRLQTGSGVRGRGSKLDYAFDIGTGVRAVVLDTANARGGSGGRLDAAQLDWLARRLEAGGRWIVVFSHHPLGSFSGGRRALALLDGSARVVAAVAGDSHRSSIVPRDSAGGGYWLITTGSLIDYPQQARAFRLMETAGGVALETWMIDHTDANLAGASRELAFLDAQGGRPASFAGDRLDRNVRLFKRAVPAPASAR